MNLIELNIVTVWKGNEAESTEKVIFNFNYLVTIRKYKNGSRLFFDKDPFELKELEVRETPEEIEKLLREIGHFVKRVYKPETIFVPSSSGV